MLRLRGSACAVLRCMRLRCVPAAVAVASVQCWGERAGSMLHAAASTMQVCCRIAGVT
jgi:hypothetical protein